MSKKDETLKDLMLELNKTYKQCGDEIKVKQILEANGYEIKYMFNGNWFIQIGEKKFIEIEFGKTKDKRYFHLSIKETDNPLLDRLANFFTPCYRPIYFRDCSSKVVISPFTL